jgi:LacI family transcriptional regulator
MSNMKDVARVAQVSIATVSHVLNETRVVSPELAERVKAAMQELSYTPDATARSFRIGRTQTFGLVIPDNSNPFFAELARVIEDEGFEAGYTTIFGNSNDQVDRELKYVQTLVSKRVEGLILSPCGDHDERALERLLSAEPVPVVVIDRNVQLPRADVLLCDNAGGSYEATRHLLELGHTRIVCIAGSQNAEPAAERVRGFRQALEDAGLEADPGSVVESDFRYLGGRAAMARLIESHKRLTAIVAGNDLIAAGALRELAAHGIRVPQKVSVVGFDDAELAQTISPAITTVRQPLREIAQMAVSLLLAQIAGEESDAPTRHIFPTELVIRESTAAPPRRPVWGW